MSDTYLLGIDVGTTGTKSILFDAEGKFVSKGYVEYPVTIPKPGWVEQDQGMWWEAVIKSLKSAVGRVSVPAGDITCVGLSGQTNSPSFIAEDGKPLLPCIVWMDKRCEPQVAWIRRRIGEEKIHRITGVKVDSFYSYCKIMWMMENQPEIMEQTKVILQPKRALVPSHQGHPLYHEDAGSQRHQNNSNLYTADPVRK